jgi:hypothetical protein
MSKPKPDLKDKIRELQLKRLAQAQRGLRSTGSAPSKRAIKVHQKQQNTFEKNLRGVPGGGWFAMAHATKTGTRTGPEIGLLRSARNANTTQGSYVQTIVREGSRVVSDSQGRKVFGR